MKKENNIEVTRTVRFKLIGTYDIGDGFYVDIVLDRETQMYDYWLYNKDYDIKIVYPLNYQSILIIKGLKPK